MRKYLSDLLPQTNPELIKKGSPAGPRRQRHTFSVSHTQIECLSPLCCVWGLVDPVQWRERVQTDRKCQSLSSVDSNVQAWRAESFQTIRRLGIIATRGGLGFTFSCHQSLYTDQDWFNDLMEEQQSHRSKTDKGQNQVISLKSANKVQGEPVKTKKEKWRGTAIKHRSKSTLSPPGPWINLKSLTVQLRVHGGEKPDSSTGKSICAAVLVFAASFSPVFSKLCRNILTLLISWWRRPAATQHPDVVWFTDPGRKMFIWNQVRIIRPHWRDQIRQSRNRIYLR